MSSRLLACSLAVAAAWAPPEAHGQSPDPERPSVRLGPVELSPRLAFTNVGIDFNVFNESANPKRDFTFVARPDLEISINPGRLRLAFTSGTEFVYFREYTSERSVNRSFGGRADLDLTFLKPFASISSGHTSSRANSEIDARARHHPRLYTAGTKLKVASRTEMVFTAREGRDSYDEGVEFRGVELARTLDQRTRGYDAAFNVALTPFTTAGLVVTKEEQRFDRSPLRDSDSWRIAPTLTFSPLGLITGSASVGYRRFRGLDASLPSYSGLVSNGTIGILFVSRYKLDTVFTRDVRYSYEEALPYYLVTGIRATLAAQAVGMLELRVLGSRESMAYRGTGAVPGRDRLKSYGAGVGYRVGDRARIVVDFEVFSRTSTLDPSREYRNPRIAAGLAWGALNR
ncbi:MAG: outer membrane beta-barrel protein [Acidobacteriota bacterium]|nr:outer membrane beta-barrel protein [Acidobacteriota bacterium]